MHVYVHVHLENPTLFNYTECSYKPFLIDVPTDAALVLLSNLTSTAHRPQLASYSLVNQTSPSLLCSQSQFSLSPVIHKRNG